MNAPSLFDAVEDLPPTMPCPHCHGHGTVPRATKVNAGFRAKDPGTSHAAAKSMSAETLNRQTTEVLAAVYRAKYDGMSAYEVSKAMSTEARPVQQNVVARRLTDLRRLGLVRTHFDTRPGPTGRQQTVYQVTRDGVDVARRILQPDE